jgi:hypothetical protein
VVRFTYAWVLVRRRVECPRWTPRLPCKDSRSWIEDRECNNFLNYNTTECGFDGGDCLGTSMIAVVLNTDNQMYQPMTVSYGRRVGRLCASVYTDLGVDSNGDGKIL